MTDPVDPRSLMTAAERALFAAEPNPVTALLKDAEHFAMSLAEGDFALVNVKGNVPPVQFRAFKRMVYQTTKARVLITNVPEGVDVAHLPADVLAAALDERGKDMIDRHKRAIQAASSTRPPGAAVTPADSTKPEPLLAPGLSYSVSEPRFLGEMYKRELFEARIDGTDLSKEQLAALGVPADFLKPTPYSVSTTGLTFVPGWRFGEDCGCEACEEASMAEEDRVEYGPEPAGDDIDHGHVVKTGLQQMYESAVTPEARAMVKSGRYTSQSARANPPREGGMGPLVETTLPAGTPVMIDGVEVPTTAPIKVYRATGWVPTVEDEAHLIELLKQAEADPQAWIILPGTSAKIEPTAEPQRYTPTAHDFVGYLGRDDLYEVSTGFGLEVCRLDEEGCMTVVCRDCGGDHDAKYCDDYVEGRGTVRSCTDCGEEVDGGPTRCVPCADKLEAQDMPRSFREARARTVEGVAEKVDALLEQGSLARRVLGVKRLAPGETPRTPKDVTATAMVWNGQVEARVFGRWVMPPIYRFVAAHTRDADAELDEEQAAYDIASGFVQTEDKIVWQLAQAAVMASGDIQLQASNIRQLIESLVSVMAKHRQIPATFAINRAQVVDLVKAKDEGWLEPVTDRELVLAGHIATIPELGNALICTTPGWNSKALTYAEETIPPGYVLASAPTHYAGQFSIQSTVSIEPFTAVIEGTLCLGLASTQHVAAALTNPYAVAIGRLT